MKPGVKVAVLAAALVSPGCKKEEPASPPPPTPRAEGGEVARGPSVPPVDGPSAPRTEAKAKPPEGCNSDFSQPVQADFTLTEACSPYTLSRDLKVEGFTLTVGPGVELRIAAGQGVLVGYDQDARILVKGTAEKPVRIVGARAAAPGTWRQIVLYAKAGGSSFEHAVLEGAGEGDKAAIEVQAPDVRVRHVRFAGLKAMAVREVADAARTVELADSDFTGAGSEIAAELYFRNVEAIQGANRWPDKAVIQVQGGVAKDLKVPNPGVPYRVVGDVNVDAKGEGGSALVTVAPGTSFQVAKGSSWFFGYGQSGGLQARGTAEQPIVWTVAGDAGSWRGLTFHEKASAPVLEYVRIEAAGEAGRGAIHYANAPKLGTLTHSTVSRSAGVAVRAEGDKAEPFEAFSDNAFVDIAQATLSLDAHLASGLGTGNAYPSGGGIELRGHIHRDTVLTAQGVPYVVPSEISVEGGTDGASATLTVEPGATVRFSPGSRFLFGYSRAGALKALGTAEKQIVFTAADSDWNGFEFDQKGSLQVENALFEKVSASRAAIKVMRGSEGGSIRDVLFKAAKLPISNCAGKKVKVERVKADPGVKPVGRKGC